MKAFVNIAGKIKEVKIKSRGVAGSNYLKEKTFKYATIKITVDKEKIKVDDCYIRFKDLRYCVDILYPAERIMMFCEPTLKKLFNSIKREMYV